MRIISFRKLREFFDKDQAAKVSMQDWFKCAKRVDWEDCSDMNKTFNSVDSIGNGLYVFNVRGNHYRVVAKVIFSLKRIYIRWVGNHKDYDRVKDIDKL